MKLTNKNLEKINVSQDHSSSQLPDIKDPSFWTVFASVSISVCPSRDSVFFKMGSLNRSNILFSVWRTTPYQIWKREFLGGAPLLS
jgi:hypothetical protein